MKAAKHKIRVIIPDSHGSHIDPTAAAAFMADLKALNPDEIVGLGDHLDAGGVFNAHQLSYTNEMPESYEDDCSATNLFLDGVQSRAPNAVIHYIEGNHEAHVERWAARVFRHQKDAEGLLRRYGPEKALGLRKRGIKYYRSSEMYQGIAIPGTIRLGKCYFTHGVSAAKDAARGHARTFGANVVFGHVHRSMSVIERSVSSDGCGAWCPGTLAKLHALYHHTRLSDWTHGYGLQFVNESTGTFLHINVPIVKGKSLLLDVTGTVYKRAKGRAAA